MLEISLAKVAHVIVRAREIDAKVAAWEDLGREWNGDHDANSILEDLACDATAEELAEFIAGLNEDERASIVALTWIGRGTFAVDELDEAMETAKAERGDHTEYYLLSIPLLADYLEEALEKFGHSIEDVENGIL